MGLNKYFLFFSYSEYRFIYNETSIKRASEQLVQKEAHNWESLIGFLDLFILAKCDFVAATFSSNFGRLVYEFMHIDDPNPFNRFKSLDLDYVLHGYNSNIKSKQYNIDLLPFYR